MIVVAIIGLLAAIAIPNFVKARTTSQMNACINNLRLIDSSKQQWALEQRKTATDTPQGSDLQPYLGRGSNGELPSCPADWPRNGPPATPGGSTLSAFRRSARSFPPRTSCPDGGQFVPIASRGPIYRGFVRNRDSFFISRMVGRKWLGQPCSSGAAVPFDRVHVACLDKGLMHGESRANRLRGMRAASQGDVVAQDRPVVGMGAVFNDGFSPF